jgi:hypothetical protein
MPSLHCAPPGDWNAGRHRPTPSATHGQHASTGKPIAPLASAFNPEAFTDTAKMGPAVWKLPSVKSTAQCGTGHSSAEQGDFGDDRLRLSPGLSAQPQRD